MKKLFSVLTSFVVACLALLPCFLGIATKTSHAQSNEAYCVVLPESFNSTYFSSNISGTNAALSSYVPYSFNQETDVAVEFNNKLTISFESLTEDSLTNQSDVSLFVYLYFPNYSSNATLKIKIFDADENSNDRWDNEIRWTIPSESLFYEEEQDLLVPGWRKIEFPLRSATPYKDGVENDPIYLKDLGKLSVEYSITEEAIAVFGAYLAESSDWGKTIDSSADNKNQVQINANSLESYSYIETSAYYRNFVVGKLKDDTIKLPSAEQVFVGAKIGGQIITATSGNLNAGLYYKTISGKSKTESAIPYVLKLRISSPNGQVKYYSLGQTPQPSADSFSQTGKYYIQLVLLGEVSEDRWEEFAAAESVELNISDNVSALWFDTTITNIFEAFLSRASKSIPSFFIPIATQISLTPSDFA